MLNELATQIYDYVAERIQDNYSPTVREICTDLGIKSTSTVHKYLNMLIKDPSFETLQNAVESEDFEEIFRAAHTIKGMALNLELPPLAAAASDLTEYLRYITSGEADISVVKEKYEKIRNEYETVLKLME